MNQKLLRSVLTLLFLISAAFFSVSCGSDNPSGTIYGSCSVTSSGITTCYDYTGSAFSTASTAQTTCASTSSGGVTGTYSTSACSTSGRIGTCQVSSGQAQEYYIRYLTGYNSTTAPAQCSASGGTYTSG